MNKRRLAQRDRLIVANLDLVAPIARQIAARLPRCFEVDDLVSAGNMGLIDAAAKFDARRGTPFGAYARWRIKGAILSSIRRHEWDNATMQGLEEWHKEIADPTIEPEVILENKKLRKTLDGALRIIPVREQVVLEIKYFRGSDLNVAARKLELCPSRASQLHREGLRRLKGNSRLRNLDRAA